MINKPKKHIHGGFKDDAGTSPDISTPSTQKNDFSHTDGQAGKMLKDTAVPARTARKPIPSE